MSRSTTSSGAVAAPTALAAALLSSCVSSVPPVEPFTVRAEASMSYTSVPAGSVRATDGRDEGFVKGDRVDFEDDLGLGGSVAPNVLLEGRVTDDDELRVSFRRTNELEGDEVLGHVRHFDGHEFSAGETVRSELHWNRTQVSYGHRVAAFRGDGPAADVVVHAGAERDEWTASISGSHGQLGNRTIIVGSPFVGIDTRIAVGPETTVLVGFEGGALRHGDKDLLILDGAAALRRKLSEHVDLTVGFETGYRNATVSRGTGERSYLRMLALTATIALGFGF